jgi:hypothetical protein
MGDGEQQPEIAERQKQNGAALQHKMFSPRSGQ